MDVGRRAAARRILGVAVVSSIVLGIVTGLSMVASESVPPRAPADVKISPQPVPVIAPGDLEDPRLTGAASSCFQDLNAKYAHVPNFEVWVEALHRNSDRVTRSLILELQIYASKNDRLAYEVLDCTVRTVALWRHPQPLLHEDPAPPKCPTGQHLSATYFNGAKGWDCLSDQSDQRARADPPDQPNRPIQPPDEPDQLDLRDRPELPGGPAVTPGQPAPGQLAPGRSEPGRPTPGRPTPGRPTPERSSPEESQPERSSPEEPTPERSSPQRSSPQRSEPQRSQPQRSSPEQSQPQRSTPDESTPERPTVERSTPERSTPERSTVERSTPERPTDEGSEPEH
ncbi:MAG: hypothetical protein V7646_41 [Pseudonocardia sp.]